MTLIVFLFPIGPSHVYGGRLPHASTLEYPLQILPPCVICRNRARFDLNYRTRFLEARADARAVTEGSWVRRTLIAPYGPYSRLVL
jgi:hypothetical protein